ncbi:MAG TPA: GNAT family N-acetyltransferase [Micromonospora sp.]
MTIVFTRHDRSLGEFSVRTLDPVADGELLHRWVTHPRSVFWLMSNATLEDVIREYSEIAARPDHDAFIGLHEGAPAFLVERYDPRRELGAYYEVQPGDVGMHFLTAPPEKPLHGFTRAVIVTVMEMLFSDPATRRVVVEPDVRNTAVHVLNEYVGFRVVDTIQLPHKTALLSICTREQYESSPGARR